MTLMPHSIFEHYIERRFQANFNRVPAAYLVCPDERTSRDAVIMPDVRCGSWLRDNALTQPATLHVPVNVVRHGRSEQLFPVERSGTASEAACRMLGKVWLEIGTQWGLHTHALIAASNALVPTIFMTRVRL